MNGSRSHADDQSSFAFVSSQIAVHLVEVSKECVHSHQHTIDLIALEELLKKGIAAVHRIGEWLGHNYRTAKPAIRLYQFTKQIVVALL